MQLVFSTLSFKYKRQSTFVLTVAVAASIFCAGAAFAGLNSFVGSWKLDPEKSEGPPSGLQQMTVKQSGDRLDLEMKLSGPQGERTGFQIPTFSTARKRSLRRS